MLIRVLVSLVLMLALQPRVLQRAHDGRDRTRISTLNCRTLLADERMCELDAALTAKGIDICALQETRREGFMSLCHQKDKCINNENIYRENIVIRLRVAYGTIP